MAYKEEDLLQISGLQHFAFCRRQWALIHVETQWAENFFTADGHAFHKRAHDGEIRESRGDCVTVRGIQIHSFELGIAGTCDVVEFRRGRTGVPIKGQEGLWIPYPVEYKRGKPKSHEEADKMQLCAQAMCLEEMLCCFIPAGALYYGEVRHRQEVELTEELRRQVRRYLDEMHRLYERGYTPKAKVTKACSTCSLQEICIPKLSKTPAASTYIRQNIQ